MSGTEQTWADRFRAARKAAGFSSSEKFAKHVGAATRTALRWETGEAYPRSFVAKIASVSPAFRELMEELPPESVQVDAPAAARVRRLELGLEALERRVARLEQRP